MTNMNAQQIAAAASARMHTEDDCAQSLKMTVDEIVPGSATVSMIASKAYANGHGVCQGGIVTTLADTAFAHACNSYNRLTVAQGLSIEFIRPAIIGEKMTAVATEQSRGKRTGVYQVKVFNPQQKLLAIMSGKSFEHGEPIISI